MDVKIELTDPSLADDPLIKKWLDDSTKVAIQRFTEKLAAKRLEGHPGVEYFDLIETITVYPKRS